MTSTSKAQPLAAARAASDQIQRNTRRYVASKEIPGSSHVYLTETGTNNFILHTDTLWMGEWKLGYGGITLPDLYRHARQLLKAKQLTIHVSTLNLATDLLDELPDSDRHFGRLAVVWDEAMPTPPPNPDQELIDWMAEFEAEIEADRCAG